MNDAPLVDGLDPCLLQHMHLTDLSVQGHSTIYAGKFLPSHSLSHSLLLQKYLAVMTSQYNVLPVKGETVLGTKGSTL